MSTGLLVTNSPVGVRRAAEALIAVAVVVWALRSIDLRALLAGLGRGPALFAGVVVVLVLATQYVSTTGHHYPFSAWSMYSVPTDSARYVEVWSDASGSRERIRLASVLPSVTPRPFATTLLVVSLAHEAGNEQATEALRELLHLVGERAGEPPGSQISVLVCTVENPTAAEPSTCAEALTTQLDGGEP